MIDCLFSELEDEQGCVFVSHALGYITATKYGLTECELLDILTCDANVSTKNITAIDRLAHTYIHTKRTINAQHVYCSSMPN